MARRLICLLLFVFCCRLEAAAPNIVLILADDMGWSDAGCYGSEIKTPAIDSLAAGGELSTRCYPTPRCSPSRASLLTGMYPQAVGVGHLDQDQHKPGYRGFLSPSIPTLAEILKKEKNYRNYMAGKWHLGTGEGRYPWQRGFDRYRGLLSGACGYFRIDEGRLMAEDGRFLENEDLPPSFYMTEDITRTALSYLDDAAKHANQPFFLYVAYTAPHSPLEARQKTIETYLNQYQSGFETVRAARLQRQKKARLVPLSFDIPRDRRLPSSSSKEERLRMAIYAAQITDMDEGIGRILKKVAEKGMAKDTVVLFLSDNGATRETPSRDYSPYPGFQFTQSGYGKNWASVSNTPYRGYKIETFEGGVAVPCIVRYPGKLKPKTLNHMPLHFMDIAPTLLSWAGIQKPEHMEGTVLDDSLQSPDRDRLLFCEHSRNKFVLSKDYKLVFNQGGSKWLLFSTDDRQELHDLSPQHPDVVESMKKSYKEWAKANNAEQ